MKLAGVSFISVKYSSHIPQRIWANQHGNENGNINRDHHPLLGPMEHSDLHDIYFNDHATGLEHEDIELDFIYNHQNDNRKYNDNDSYIINVLRKNKIPRKLNKKLRQQRDKIDLNQFDINHLPLIDDTPASLSIPVNDSVELNGFIESLLNVSYLPENKDAFHSRMMAIVSNISQYHEFLDISTVNLLIRYLIRRGKWDLIFKVLGSLPSYGITPNKVTFCWLLRGCHNYKKSERIQLIKFILNLGFDKWKMDCSKEIRMLIWLSLPYCKEWKYINERIFNEGLSEYISSPIIYKHFIRNVMAEMVGKCLNPTRQQQELTFKPYEHIYRVLQIKLNRLNIQDNDCVMSQILRYMLHVHKNEDYHIIHQLLLHKRDEITLGRHVKRVISHLLADGRILQAILAMNDFIRYQPEIKPILVSVILQSLQSRAVPTEHEVVSQLANAHSRLFDLQWGNLAQNEELALLILGLEC